MSTDDEPTGRDLKVMWRTVAVVAVIASATVGTIITAVVWEVKQDARLDQVEKWQAAKDKQTAEDARRELWRRDREKWAPATPPKS